MSLISRTELEAMFAENAKHHKPCPKCGELIVSRPGGVKPDELCLACAKAQATQRDRENRKWHIGTPEGQNFEGISPDYHGADFADFEEHSATLELWYLTREKPLLLWGGCGGGKTRAIYAIRRRAYIDNIEVIGGGCGQILRDAEAVRYAFGGALRDYVRRFANHRGIVILDDFGAGAKIDDFQASVLSEIISIREEHGRGIVVSSNLNLSEIAGLLGDRTASRLSQAVNLHFDYPDRRLARGLEQAR